MIKDVILTSSSHLAGSFTVKFDAQGKPVPTFGGDASVNDVCAEDVDYVSRGMIPYSYWIRPSINDIHPNEFGAKAFATAVYKKIVELGYVD